MAVPGFFKECAHHNNLLTFLHQFQPRLSGTTFSEAFIDGGQNPQGSQPSIEASLDTQYAVGLTNGNPVTFISSGLSDIGRFINFANHVLEQDQPPTVFVMTYGFDESKVSQTRATKLCGLCRQLGSRGVSVIVATGDDGVGGSLPGS